MEKITARHIAAFGHFADAMRAQYPNESNTMIGLRVNEQLISFGSPRDFVTAVYREWSDMMDRFGGQGR